MHGIVIISEESWVGVDLCIHAEKHEQTAFWLFNILSSSNIKPENEERWIAFTVEAFKALTLFHLTTASL